MAGEAKYKRVLLKLSGEALMGDKPYGIDTPTLERLVSEILAGKGTGVQFVVVIGGGNIFRGLSGAAEGLDRATGDYMGMLATLINALALQEAFIRRGHEPFTTNAFTVASVVPPYERRAALRNLELGKVLLLAGGTGRPFFTTDTAAALRAIELNCDILLKGSHIDGVYDSDPEINPSAKRYNTLSYTDAIDMKLKIMDLTAFSLCYEHRLPLVVFDIRAPGNLHRVLAGDMSIGTFVK
jgi:uridylate kinase